YGDETGFLYSNGSFSPIAVPGAAFTSPSAINNLGQIVGDFSGPPAGNFLYSGGSYTTVAPPGTFGAWTNHAINDSGQVVGTSTSGGPAYGFLYSVGSYTTIAPPGSSNSWPQAINSSGQVV